MRIAGGKQEGILILRLVVSTGNTGVSNPPPATILMGYIEREKSVRSL